MFELRSLIAIPPSWVRFEHRVATYAIAERNFVKIGRSNNVGNRIRSLQVGNPHQLVILGLRQGDIELNTHLELAERRVHRGCGEWFDLRGALKILPDHGLVWAPSRLLDFLERLDG